MTAIVKKKDAEGCDPIPTGAGSQGEAIAKDNCFAPLDIDDR